MLFKIYILCLKTVYCHCLYIIFKCFNMGYYIIIFVRFIFTSSCLLEGACFIYAMCVCLRIVVSNTYCVVFLFGFLPLVYPILPVSLDCAFYLLSLRYSLTCICMVGDFKPPISIKWTTYTPLKSFNTTNDIHIFSWKCGSRTINCIHHIFISNHVNCVHT